MSNEIEQKSGRNGLAGVALVALLPVIYVLSIGPIGGSIMTCKKESTVIAIQVIYRPVFWLRDHTLLKEALDAYAGLWGGKLGL